MCAGFGRLWAAVATNAKFPVILRATGALATFIRPSHILMYGPGDSRTCRSCFILCTTAALAALVRPGHILAYAPGDSRTCRLAVAQIISQDAFPVILRATGALATFIRPSHILMYGPGDSRTCRSCFILCTTAALAALVRPGHILAYAPGDSRTCRLAVAQIISQDAFPVILRRIPGIKS